MSGISSDKFQVLAQLQEILTNYSPDIVLPLPDGVLSFTYRLVMELIRDCLTKYHLGRITSAYLEHLQQNIRTLVHQAEEKSQSGELAFLNQLAQNVLFILEYPAHSLESSETSESDSEEEQDLSFPDIDSSQCGRHIDLIEDITVSANTDGGVCETPEIIHESASALIGSSPVRKPCKSDYDPIKLISSGSFGAVHLVRHKDTNQILAMKKLDKQNLRNPERLELAFLERDILIFADCPFVASMFCSFPTKHHLCMVMDYVAGGDCGSFLKSNGPLPVTLARMYIAETVLAVEYLHSYGVVHRDLKPENLLITSSGHIKVTDFGLSKVGLMRPTSNIYKAPIEDITREFLDDEIVGTVSYIAPEVILRDGYGRLVDWWSIGVILYQFLVGRLPFEGPTRYETFYRILKEDITWKLHFYSIPPDAHDFITDLLRKNPAHRLGTGGAIEIKIHPYMSDLDFETLLSQEPLYVPQLESEEDTHCFSTRSRRHKHMDSDEEDTSEGIYWLDDQNFVSSSLRHFKLCTTNTRVMNMDDPKPPPENSPESSSKQSDMQKESSPSRTDGDNQCFTAKDSSSPSSALSEFPVQKKGESALRQSSQQETGKVEKGERRRGSRFRRFISSCRRGLSRAAHAIRESCLFAMCHKGTLNISDKESFHI